MQAQVGKGRMKCVCVSICASMCDEIRESARSERARAGARTRARARASATHTHLHRHRDKQTERDRDRDRERAPALAVASPGERARASEQADGRASVISFGMKEMGQSSQTPGSRDCVASWPCPKLSLSTPTPIPRAHAHTAHTHTRDRQDGLVLHPDPQDCAAARILAMNHQHVDLAMNHQHVDQHVDDSLPVIQATLIAIKGQS